MVCFFGEEIEANKRPEGDEADAVDVGDAGMGRLAPAGEGEESGHHHAQADN